MKDLFEMLDKAHELDESTMNTEAYNKLTQAAEKSKLYMSPNFIAYAMEDNGSYVDDVIENEIIPVGEAVKKQFPNVAQWRHFDNEEFNAIQIYTIRKNARRWGDWNFEGFFEYAHGLLHNVTDEVKTSNLRAHPIDESTKGDAVKKLKDAASSVKCKLTLGFKRYALESPEHIDNIIEDELLYCGQALCKEFPNMKYWKFGENEKLCDMYGSYCIVETGTDEGRILVQLDGHGRIYHLEESLYEATTSETIYEDWDDVFCAIEDIIESCIIFGRHPYWFDAYQKPDRLMLDIGVDDDDTGRTGSHYEATLSNLHEVPTNTNELIKYVENLPWKANGETDVDDKYDLDDDM